MDPKILDGLKAESYRHPLEAKALENLLKTKGLQRLVNKFQEIGLEQNLKLQYQSSCVKVTATNFNHLQYLIEKAANILQVNNIPDLFIKRSDQLDGISIGVDSPMIILSTEAIDKLSNQELLFLIGREMAHIDHKHTLYKEIGLIFPELIEAFSVITLGLSSLVSAGLKYALYTWDLMSEYTADRGGLLTCQDKSACLSLMAKLAGWPERNWSAIHLEEFEQQARSFDAGPQKAFDKIINYMLGDSSWAIARAQEIINWIDDDEGGYHQFVGAA